MTFPRNMTKFLAWTKAMVAGATVDKPEYGKSLAGQPKPKFRARRRRRRFRRKRKDKDA